MTHPFTQRGPTDKFTWHKCLLPIYARLFEPIRDSTDSVMELGTDGGFGVIMYADYFAKAKSVIAVDIAPRPASLDADKRIEHFQADAYSPNFVHDVSSRGPFSLIVDDGSHFPQHQLAFVRQYPALLAPDGIAIIEDVQRVEYIQLFADALSPEFFGMAIDVRHYGRYDDLIFVIIRA